eukprot:gene4045-2898_t
MGYPSRDDGSASKLSGERVGGGKACPTASGAPAAEGLPAAWVAAAAAPRSAVLCFHSIFRCEWNKRQRIR